MSDITARSLAALLLSSGTTVCLFARVSVRVVQVVVASLSIIFLLMCLTFALVFKSGAVHLND